MAGNGPTKKFFGSISLDGIKKAVTQIPGKVDDSEKYGKQIKVTGAQWDDGGVSIEIWDGEAKESIKIGRLLVSTFDDAPKPVESSRPLDF